MDVSFSQAGGIVPMEGLIRITLPVVWLNVTNITLQWR